MKKQNKTLIFLCFFFLIVPCFSIQAYDKTKLYTVVTAISKRTVCKTGEFEVTTVDKNGTVPNGTCYASSKYNDAVTKMESITSNFDIVSVIIQYGDSSSLVNKTRIVNAKYALIDMDRYDTTKTTNLYLTATASSAFTSINGWNGAEAAFRGTTIGSNGLNRSYLTIAGFTGYVAEGKVTSSEKTRPVYNIVPISLLVPDKEGKTLASYYYINDNNDLVHAVALNIHTKYNYSLITLGPAPAFMKKGIRYYSYDGIYFYQNDLMALLDDYKEGTSRRSVNADSPYYNYYQFMPYRLKTNYTKEDINNYVENRYGLSYTVKSGDTFAIIAEKYDVTEAAIKEINGITKLIIGSTIKIPAARINFEKYFELNAAGNSYQWKNSARPSGNITQFAGIGDDLIKIQDKYSQNAILTLAHSTNESGNGKSFLAFSKNNLFGLNAVDSDAINKASRYNSVEDCINNFADGYVNFLYGDPGIYAKKNYSTYYYGLYFGNKGSGMNVKYATDPYWGEKVAQHYYAFDKANGMLDGDNKKRIAIKKERGLLPVYKDASTTSTLLYKVKEYAINVPMVILGEVTGKDGKLWYKIATDIALDKNRDPITLDDGTFKTVDRTYHEEYSYGYILASEVIVPNEGKYYEEVAGEYYYEDITFDKEKQSFLFKGFLALKDLDNKKTADIQFNLIAVNVNTKEETIFELSRWTKDYPFEIPNDSKKDYSGAWFQGSVDLNELPQGDYLLYVTNTLGSKRAKAIVSNAFGKEIQKVTNDKGRGYQFRTNYYLKTNQVELFIRDEGLISNINNPTIDNMFNEYSAITPITLKETMLNIKGTSFNIQGNYAKDQTVERFIILENVDTFERVVYDKIGSLTSGDYQVTLRQNDNLDKTRAWYQASLDLSNLKDGTYSIQVRTKTGKIDDYGELTNIFATSLNINEEHQGKEYRLSINTNKRNRIELTVKTLTT